MVCIRSCIHVQSLIGLEFIEHLLCANLCPWWLLGLCHQHFQFIGWLLVRDECWEMVFEDLIRRVAGVTEQEKSLGHWNKGRTPNKYFPSCPDNCSQAVCVNVLKSVKAFWVSLVEFLDYLYDLSQVTGPCEPPLPYPQMGGNPYLEELLWGLKGKKDCGILSLAPILQVHRI